MLPTVRVSGAIDESPGDVTLTGPAGSVRLRTGAIIAARHFRLSAHDTLAWGLRDGDLLDVRCGVAGRALTLHDVVVRAGPAYATELHLDADGASAVGVDGSETAIVPGLLRE